MLTLLTLFASLASAQSGSATLDGTDCGPTSGCQTYSVDLEPTGAFSDSYGRSGTYSLAASPTGPGRVLTLDMGRAGVTTLNEGPQNCWEEASPPVYPGLGQLAICISAKEHEFTENEAACNDVNTGPTEVFGVDPSESRHRLAGRLSPNSPGGFWVHKLSYFLYYGGLGCGSAQHGVDIFVGSAGDPPSAYPSVVHSTGFGNNLVNGFNEMTVELDEPLFLAPGESVFVSIEMVNDMAGFMCATTCGTTAQSDLTWLSDDFVVPFGWTDQEPYMKNLLVTAAGLFGN